MNPARLLGNTAGVIAGAATAVLLFGCMVYDNSAGYGYSGSVGASYGYVEIGADSDFDAPLSPYGRWEVVGGYGRCWVPGGVGSGWRPYCDGEWVSTDDGWYFESDEPWGWATYHYGRWMEAPSFGWCWIPGTQWGPAWVSWWEGDGYVGWAPLGPGDRYERGRFEGRRPRDRDCVFVEERRFTERVRPTTVVRDNPTVFNRTTQVTNIRVVNNVTVNAGPHRENIERASGRTLRTVPARDVRRQREAPVLQRRQQQRPVTGRNVEPERGAPPRAGAIAPAVAHPVTPPATSPATTPHREHAPVRQPPSTVAPGNGANNRANHPRSEGTQEHRTVTPPREATPPTTRVMPVRPAEGQTVAPTHVTQPVRPATTPAVQPAPVVHPAPKAQATPRTPPAPKVHPAPKSEGEQGDHGQKRGDDQDKSRQQQAN